MVIDDNNLGEWNFPDEAAGTGEPVPTTAIVPANTDQAIVPANAIIAAQIVPVDMNVYGPEDVPEHRGNELYLDHEPGMIQLGYRHENGSPQPEELRIGPKRHKYVYTRVGDCLYKCSRPSDFGQWNGPNPEVLWLRRGVGPCGHSWWDAYDAPANANNPPVTNPIFWTFECAIEDGKHHWKLAFPGQGHGSGGDFQTTILRY